MTRKDYVAFAELVSRIQPRFEGMCGNGYLYIFHTETEGDPLEDLVAGMADVFAADNPRFDRGRFMAACGMAS